MRNQIAHLLIFTKNLPQVAYSLKRPHKSFKPNFCYWFPWNHRHFGIVQKDFSLIIYNGLIETENPKIPEIPKNPEIQPSPIFSPDEISE